MTKIKICGLTSMDDILTVNEVKPDYIGFVFAPSKRQISSDFAANLKAALSPDIQSAGVFVNSDLREIVTLVNDGVIDLIQLHGDETPGFIRSLKEMISVPIIKAVRVQTAEDILFAQDFPCDYLLLDTYTKNSYGGTGITFDWSLIPPFCKPYFLAGGLEKNNISEAANTSAYCLDISSGVETNGKKDPSKIKHIIEIIRRTQ